MSESAIFACLAIALIILPALVLYVSLRFLGEYGISSYKVTAHALPFFLACIAAAVYFLYRSIYG